MQIICWSSFESDSVPFA